MNSKLFTKKILTLITAIALFVGVGLVYGFTSTDEKPQAQKVNKKLVIQQWYGLTSTDDEDPNNQNITGVISAPPSSGGSCAQVGNDGSYCAVLLQFSGTTAPTLNNISVQSAIDSHGASVVTGSATNGYSRLPE